MTNIMTAFDAIHERMAAIHHVKNADPAILTLKGEKDNAVCRSC